jgi:hypothetical protein
MPLVRVGWFVDVERGAVLYQHPRPLNHTFDFGSTDPKAPTHCPAVQSFAIATFAVPCPFTLALRCVARGAGWEFRLDRRRSEVDADAAERLITPMSRREWRHPERPIVQLLAPYVFIADDEVEVAQTPAHQHYHSARPGVMIAGAFPIRDWPRPLSYAFEWHDTGATLRLQRGEPWFYVSLRAANGERVRLERIEKSPAIEKHMAHVADVASYTARTFDLMERAREVRPPRLLPEPNDVST